MRIRPGRRSAAAALGFAVVLTALLPLLFISLHANHHCEGDSCGVCALLRVAHMQVRAALSWLAAAALATLWAGLAITPFSPGRSFHVPRTLVAQKVRMND
jgi:hypothetical protein